MSNYFIKAIILEGCPYSMKAEELLKTNNIPSDFIHINHNDKKNHKSHKISTFPQLYLKKYNNNGNLLIGGYNELNEFINNFKGTKYDEMKINNFIKKNNDWSKKTTLRLIELINK